MNREAVLIIIQKANELKISAETRKKNKEEEIQKEYDSKAGEYKSLILAAQTICPHNGNIREEYYEDYHKNEHGYDMFCEDCGKYLGSK